MAASRVKTIVIATASQIMNLTTIQAVSTGRGGHSAQINSDAVRYAKTALSTPVLPVESTCRGVTPTCKSAIAGCVVSPIAGPKRVCAGQQQQQTVSPLIAALCEASRLSRFEVFTFAILTAGSLVSLVAGLAQTERLLAGWSWVVRLIETVLS
jgi:hypothetical protein